MKIVLMSFVLVLVLSACKTTVSPPQDKPVINANAGAGHCGADYKNDANCTNR